MSATCHGAAARRWTWWRRHRLRPRRAFFGEPDELLGHDWPGFAGIAVPRLRLFPVEAHIAEKLHAHSLPRSRTSARVKHLPDLARLGTPRRLHGPVLRGTHPPSPPLPDPPAEPEARWTWEPGEVGTE